MSARHPQQPLKKKLEIISQRLGAEMRAKNLGIAESDHRKKLNQQIMRDTREEAVEEVLDECLQTYWESGGGNGTSGCEDESIIRSVLLTAANLWSIGSDQASAE
jgi:hypothetical protein